MSELPPIPDEAVEALMRWWYPGQDTEGMVGSRMEARGDVEQTWPHLYAAALRHAADRAGRTFTGEVHADDLRQWADEAVTE